jgi:hypothetical protein
MARPKKQIHVEISPELHDQLSEVCTETGQISILTRRLYRAFLKHMSTDAAGKDVADKWGDE